MALQIFLLTYLLTYLTITQYCWRATCPQWQTTGGALRDWTIPSTAQRRYRTSRLLHCHTCFMPASGSRPISLHSCWDKYVIDCLITVCVCVPQRCVVVIDTVYQKKRSHFNFRHKFATCWDICTIFEAPCLGLISAWYSLLHTHHRCEAFTWRGVTWSQSSCCIPPDLWPWTHQT